MNTRTKVVLVGMLVLASAPARAGDPKICCVDCTGTNTAAMFEGYWAFREADGVHIGWLTAAEKNTTQFKVYAGVDRTRPLAVVGAQGERAAHYYEITTQFGAEFQVVEVDRRGSTTSTPVFGLSEAPAELAALREQNRIIDELSSRLRKPPSEPAMAAQMPPVAYADYVFYSSKQDLLDATLPVRQKLNELGKTSMIIKGSKTPEACKTAIFAVYEHTMAYGHPLPFLVIVGNAYEDTADPRNIVGTFYYPDDEGNCFFSGGCASDVQIVDFDGDDLPDIPWTRILGTNVSEISNSVQAAVYYYNNQKIKPKRAFILDGDRTASCGSELEPRETLENIAAQYEAKGIPTVIKHASDYTACSDWAGKLADVSSIFAGGITEMLGTGLTTHRDALPGWIIQQRIAPVFTMSAVPYSQLFVAEFPGCELGGEDRLNPTYYPTIMQKFMTANPNTHANAVAWFGHKRGGWSADHLEFARRYFENRLAVYDNVTTLHHVYFNTIRELGLERPSLRGHLLLSGAYGWPVQLADMKPPTPPGGGGGGCHGCPPPQLDSPAPKVDTLNQNYPNPFNPSTTISFGLASPAKVTLVVYNVSGQRVATLLFNEDRAAGWHVSQWNGVDDHATPVATGIYFYRLTVGEKAMTRKMILIK